MDSSEPREVVVTFEIEGLPTKLHVLELTGEEAISRLYSINVVLAAPTSDVDFGEVVGKEGLLTIDGLQQRRHLHGVVDTLEQRESAAGYTVYHLDLVPAAWQLRYRQDCRIFQEMTVEQIISSVLKSSEIEFQFKITGELEPLDYCVQYRESDWDFISRLLEANGLYYFFSHAPGEHVLQIIDDYHQHPDIPGEGSVAFHAPGAESTDREHIFSFFFKESMGSGRVTLTDYNFEKPTLEMEVQGEADRHGALEIYDYPGVYDLPEGGRGLARVRVQEARTMLQVGRGESTCPRLTAGAEFSMTGHPRTALNGERFTLVTVKHRGERLNKNLDGGALDHRLTYSNSLVCIPREVQFRPARVTSVPKISGVQTAVVTGPPGEEIFTDRYGRVKVRFHWDRLGGEDDKSSCWVRVNQAWTGRGFGIQWIPRVGQEVIVDFIEGNPDRPIITGMTYHARNVQPYDLPGGKTKSSIKSDSTPGGGGSNELRFDDQKGQEHFFIHAQRDYDREVERNSATAVGQQRNVDVGASSSLSVAADRTVSVGQKQDVAVKGGDASLAVSAGNRNVNVSADYNLEATNINEEASATVNVTGKAGVNITGLSGVNIKGDPSVMSVATAMSMLLAPSITVGGSALVHVKAPLVDVEGEKINMHDGPLTINCDSVSIEAGTIEINGGTVKVKGSQVDVSSDSDVNISGGGNVKLNC